MTRLIIAVAVAFGAFMTSPAPSAAAQVPASVRAALVASYATRFAAPRRVGIPRTNVSPN